MTTAVSYKLLPTGPSLPMLPQPAPSRHFGQVFDTETLAMLDAMAQRMGESCLDVNAAGSTTMPCGLALCVGVSGSIAVFFLMEWGGPYFLWAPRSTSTHLQNPEPGELWWFDERGHYWLPAKRFMDAGTLAPRLAAPGRAVQWPGAGARQRARYRRSGRPAMTTGKRRKRVVTLRLPDEFLDVCAADGIDPETVLRGFVSDLAGIISWQSDPRTDGYNSNGSDERLRARDYYERVGYPWWNRRND